MSLTLELPPDLEKELQKEAAQLGLPLSDYALRVLSVGRLKSEMPKTGATLVAYWQDEDLVGTHADSQDSQTHARQLRHEAERRIRE